MKKLVTSLFSVLVLLALGACGKKEAAPEPAQNMPTETVEAPVVQTAPESAAEQPAQPAQEAATESAPEAISETDDEEPAEQTDSTSVQPTLKVGAASSGPATSARFKEGTHYQKIVPAQPTNAPPGKVEVAEIFWYGCTHCFSLDPALESWRAKAPGYVTFVRIPAMWNETTRMHARLFYAAELLGKLDELHSLFFREIHVNGNQLNTVEKITAFFKQHGVSADEFQKAFSSFAVESKLQRADFLNRRYRVQSVPLIIVNGKYSTDITSAGGEPDLFALLNELTAHESGG
jgi:protein dithiol oxidoreductase (disulfide-forming)